MKLTGWQTCSMFAILLASSAALGEELHSATLTEYLSRTAIRSPAISPNSKSVAFLKRETNWKENEFVWQLWLTNVSGGSSTQLTRGRKSAGAAEWSPDGRWLAFVTEREPNTIETPTSDKSQRDDKEDEPAAKPAAKQIWLIAPDGGEAWQLTTSLSNVEEFHWSRDGKSVFFTAALPPTKAVKARRERYSAYDVIEKDYDQNQLWSVDATAAAATSTPVPAKQLTWDPTLHVKSFAVSPDSKRLAFSATHNPLLAFAGDEDIFLLDLPQNKTAAGSVTRIIALPGPDRSPLFSTDGKQLAFVTALGQANFFYANSHIALVDLDKVLATPATTAADVHDLTKSFDENPQLFDYRSGGLYFGAAQGMTNQLFRLDPANWQVQKVSTDHQMIVDDVSVAPDGKSLAFIADGPDHLSELYVSDARVFAPKKLTDITAQVSGWELGSVEVVSWKSKDGTLIEGVLHKPAHYDPKHKYPLLVKIHGGPTGVSQLRYLPPDYAYPVQAFLAKGALVLEPNYRGSAGYGAAFRALNVRNLGVGDMWDVMSGVDALIGKGLVDPNRLAAMGWSQGGYISAFLTTHTNRFKAISVGAGISDWMTYYVGTDITPFTPQYLHATPWDDPQIYAKTSPITTIKQAKTPTLIQHGSADRRVPVPDAFELYRGLLDQHVDARLILYTGFGHGIDKPKSALALLQANLDWFNHYIWNEPIPKDSALNGTSELGAAEAVAN
jgi:dipeptidyl aminopeptidase/acylaminoacyl peptidase